MTLHWTIISNELTHPTVQEAQTFVKMADICCYGCTIR